MKDGPGKGAVARRMFADIEASIYVLLDGDNTYETEAAPRLIQREVTNVEMLPWPKSRNVPKFLDT
jgi:hypothetical protein